MSEIGPDRRGSAAPGDRQIAAARAWVVDHPALAVFGLGFLLRLMAIVVLPAVPYEQGGDGPHYLAIARDIVESRPYGSSVGDPNRVPLYQLFLAGHVWLFGNWVTAVAVSQALIDALTSIVLMRTAAVLGAGTRSWIVGILWATYPPAILNTLVIFPQPLQVFMLSSAFLLALTGIAQRSTGRCAAAAALFGVSCLIRAGNLMFLPVLALSPLLCWRLRRPRSSGWAVRVGVVMLLAGAGSVAWWTARNFPTTYRFEDLARNPHERRAIALVLRPLQPWPNRASAWLGGSPVDLAGLTAASDTVVSPVSLDNAFRDLRYQSSRTREKLIQAFGAPDGTVQMGCSSPPGGYWATFRSASWDGAVELVRLALGSRCMAVKSAMYFQHYLLALLTLPAMVLLTGRWPGVSLVLVAYGSYTAAAIVLGSNYSIDGLAAVPRFAFSATPVAILVVGLMLAAVTERWSPGAAGRPAT